MGLPFAKRKSRAKLAPSTELHAIAVLSLCTTKGSAIFEDSEIDDWLESHRILGPDKAGAWTLTTYQSNVHVTGYDEIKNQIAVNLEYVVLISGPAPFGGRMMGADDEAQATDIHTGWVDLCKARNAKYARRRFLWRMWLAAVGFSVGHYSVYLFK